MSTTAGPDGWRRAVVGLSVGVVVGLAVGLVLPRTEVGRPARLAARRTRRAQRAR